MIEALLFGVQFMAYGMLFLAVALAIFCILIILIGAMGDA